MLFFFNLEYDFYFKFIYLFIAECLRYLQKMLCPVRHMYCFTN